MGALGVVELFEDGFGLGAAGGARGIGPNVKDLSIGDRVILISHSSFSTLITTSEKLCAKMPDNLSFNDGATMPCVYATSIYSLFNIGRLEKGQVDSLLQMFKS